MRMMMQVEMPLEPFNTAVRNGTAGPTMKKILDDAKPEAAYFGERDGRRGGILIVNLESPSDVPRLAEPWFLNFNAEVKFRVVMSPEDLAKADLVALGKKWG
ncbi:MAG: panthothenate synthetase [Terracidiphilus sp.]